jgi:hypothetical protein
VTDIPHYNIVFCTPGNSFVPGYLKSMLMTTYQLQANGISWYFLSEGGSHVSVARERTISSNEYYANNRVTVPHNGEFTYDTLMWIDSDISWKPEDVAALCRSEHPITTGAYMLYDRKVVINKTQWGDLMPEEEFLQHTEPFRVAACGFGFVAIKSGVFESLPKPWFAVPADNQHYLIGEDVAFCIKARKADYEIWCDPSVRVNHQKSVIVDWKMNV